MRWSTRTSPGRGTRAATPRSCPPRKPGAGTTWSNGRARRAGATGGWGCPGTLFRPGETLRLVIQGTDVYRYPRPLIQALHEDSVNRGPHVVHSGGEDDSHLLMPVAPADAG